MKIPLPTVRRDTRPALLRLVAGPGLYGRATSAGRLAPSLQHVSGSVNVQVLLPFPPQAFHQAQLSSYGVFAGRHATRCSF